MTFFTSPRRYYWSAIRFGASMPKRRSWPRWKDLEQSTASEFVEALTRMENIGADDFRSNALTLKPFSVHRMRLTPRRAVSMLPRFSRLESRCEAHRLLFRSTTPKGSGRAVVPNGLERKI
jgi:hypothetical protein